MKATRMWTSLVLCFSGLVSLLRGTHGSLADELTETTQLCCTKGQEYARGHSAEDCTSSVPPDVPKDFGSFCLFAMDNCCKDYFRKKHDCESGIDIATSLKNCDATKDMTKKCCNQCLKGTSGVGEGECRKEQLASSDQQLISDAYYTCCQSSKEHYHNESISHQRGLAVTTKPSGDALFSVCDEYAPNELCAHHCIPIPGSYRCECNPGFRLMADGRNCIQVVKNRCKPKNPCEHKCNDDGVAVKCSCRRGYELMPDDKSCQDIDECSLQPAVCLPEHTCYNLQGSYRCVVERGAGGGGGQCPPGYSRNIANGACDDINECSLLHPPCAVYLCENTVGGYKCGGIAGNPVNLAQAPRVHPGDRCPQGFRAGLNDDCEDVNECAIHKDNCNPVSQFCINTRGSFHCQDLGSKFCPAGFKIDPATNKCEDIDECEHGPDLCPAGQRCVNTLGEYDCKPAHQLSRNANNCPEGMRIKQGSSECEDVDECVEGIHFCDENQNCLNTNGSYECNCKLGFKLDATTEVCTDINECATEQHDCVPQSQRCDNTVGSYLCVRILSCGTGYILHHSTGLCEDTDECALGTHDCPAGYTCANIPGTFSCVKSATTTTEGSYEYYYDSEEEDDENNKTSTSEKHEVPLITSSTSPQPAPQTSPVILTNQSTESVVPLITTATSPQPAPQTSLGSPTSQSTESVVQPTTPQTEHGIKEQNPDENSIYHSNNNVISNEPNYIEPRQAETTTPQTAPTSQETPAPDEIPKQPEQTFIYDPIGPPGTVNQFDTKELLKPTEESNTYDPGDPPTDPNTIYVPEKETPKVNTSENSFDFDHNETTYSPAVETELERTTTVFVDMVPGVDTATVKGERTEDEAVAVNTKDVPKNEWTKINEKPSACQPGFERDESGACFDIDECATQAHSCSGLTESCRNTMGGYICECAAGFRRDLTTGECALVATSTTTTTTTTLPPPTTTEYFFWGYPDRRHLTSRPFRPRTLCDAGYQLHSESGKCQDIDECTNGQANCAAVEVCVNTEGGYRCECPPSWRLDDVKHRCVPARSRPRGQFPPGYGNEPPRAAAPSVVHSPAPADDKYEPALPNLPGSAAGCPWGYRLGYDNVCEDIDECASGAAKCGPQQQCSNSPGGYTCSCPAGLRLVGDHLCEDVDECRLAGSRPICSQHADCVNTVGSYQCRCHEGFTAAPANDKVCVDVDECAASEGAGARGALCQHRCNNVWGGYRCSCHRGYRLNKDNRTCSDVDECVQYKSKVLCVGHCANEPGSYRCTCPGGYRLSEDKKSCIDINECETGEAECAGGGVSGGVSDVCVNTRGGYRCHRIACPPGYHLEDKHRCKRIEQFCAPGDWDCAHQPTTYSYNFITFVSNLYIPDNKVDLFTMRGPKWPFARMKFQLRLVNVNAPPSVKDKADINAFLLVQNSAEQAMVSLTRPLPGPQSVELELAMELYNHDQFGGTAVAKLFIYVSEHDF